MGNNFAKRELRKGEKKKRKEKGKKRREKRTRLGIEAAS